MNDAANPFRPDPAPQGTPPAPETSGQSWRAPEAAEPTTPQRAMPAVPEQPAGSPVTSAQDPVGDAPTNEEPSREEPVHEEPTRTDAAAEAPGELDEAALLDQLESDLAAVETAIASIEQIATDSVGGERAAAEIRAAVSAERFGS